MPTTKATKSAPSRRQAQIKHLTNEVAQLKEELEKAQRGPHRRRLPTTRQSVTHKFSISGHEGYLTVGHYDDG